MYYDYLIVGAGLFGAVFAQQAIESGRTVLLIERRPFVGGNAYSYDYEDTNITVHAYGTHVFHCSDARIWKYVNKFTSFNQYRHRALTTYKGQVYSMPINLGTINSFFGRSLTPREVAGFIDQYRDASTGERNLEDKAIGLIGRPLYEAFVRGYTRKQWGCDPRELPGDIIARLPVRSSYDDGYFDDVYQGIPLEGYGPMFNRLLAGVDVELNTDFFSSREIWEEKARKIVYTGPIDRFFEYCYGALKWRSVRFETRRLPLSDFQGIAIMNYADEEVPYTRIHEPKHLHRERDWNRDATVIMYEYPLCDTEEPFYPVNSSGDKELYRRYALLQAQYPNVIFGGRLAAYKYYDMHQVVASALVTAQRELREQLQTTAASRS